MTDNSFRLDYVACREALATRLGELPWIDWRDFLVAGPAGAA